MAEFVFTWNSTFEQLPADVEDALIGASRIRNLKQATRERTAIDHSWAGDAHDGKHNKATLRPLSSVPTLDLDDGMVYVKRVGSPLRTELFYKDSSGVEVQLTAAGGINSPTAFAPVGSQMLFLSAAAPSGWVLITGLADRMVRISNAGGGAGGQWEITGLTVLSHALTLDQIPNHQHGMGTALTESGSDVLRVAGLGGDQPTAAVGGNGGHSHGISHNAAWRPAYADFVLARKS